MGEGDSFDPAGTLTGGARAQTSSILEKLQQFQEVEEQLKTKKHKLNQIQKEFDSLKRVAEEYTSLKQKYDLKVQEVELVKARLEQSSHHQQLEEIQALQNSIGEQEEILKNAEETQKKMSKKVKDLEDKIKNAKALREK